MSKIIKYSCSLHSTLPSSPWMGHSVVYCRVTLSGSAFSKTWLLPEGTLWRILSCESPPVFLHFPLEEKGPWRPFYELWWVLAKGRHLLQILLKAMQQSSKIKNNPGCPYFKSRATKVVNLVALMNPWLPCRKTHTFKCTTQKNIHFCLLSAFNYMLNLPLLSTAQNQCGLN